MPPNEAKIAELIRRSAEGDRQSWDQLLEAHRPRLRKMVALRLNRRLRGRLDPSDIIQEAFIDATACLPEYVERGEMPFFLWLRWLTGMRLVTLHRKHLGAQKRDAGREISIEQAIPGTTSAALAAQLLGRQTSASEAAMRSERKARIRKALEAMDPLDREVLVLRHFEELSNIETAQALNIQVAAASKRYIRALRRLKESLSTISGGPEEFSL